MITMHVTLERRAIVHKLLLNHVQMERWIETEERGKTTSRCLRKLKGFESFKSLTFTLVPLIVATISAF